MRHTFITRRIVVCAAASMAVFGPSNASASEKARIKSRFTTVELKSCEPVKIDAEARAKGAGAWTCKGLSGYPVYVAEDDLRQFISFGTDAKHNRAATQTLKAFSSIFAPKRKRATIEWRFRRADGHDVPYATIVRFYTSSGSPKAKGDETRGDVLIVTKVTPTEVCQLARIDARANPDAIILARSAADELSADFDCKADQPRVVGATGRSPM
jgi:hypothetical protein